MTPVALSSAATGPPSAALSGFPLAFRSEEVFEDPGAPSFAGGFSPARKRIQTRGGFKEGI